MFKVSFNGRLGAAPLRSTEDNGRAAVRFDVATNGLQTRIADGWSEFTLWASCTYKERRIMVEDERRTDLLLEGLLTDLSIGDLVHIEGQLTAVYTRGSGEPRLQVRVHDVTKLLAIPSVDQN